MRTHVDLVERYSLGLQSASQLTQLPKVTRVDANDRLLLERTEREFAHFQTR